MRVERCRLLLNLMEDGMLPNLVFSDEKKFDVEQFVTHQNDRVWGKMQPWKAGEWVDARIQPLLWFGRPSQPLESLPSFSCPHEWNWTASGTSRTFWKVKCCHGPENTSREHLEPSSKTRRPHMAQEWPNGGFRPTSRRSSARNTGPQLLKEPGPESFELFGVVHPREQGRPNFSWFSRESESQISCCNKCSIFFVFIREPGQNVHCHKLGGPCSRIVIIQSIFTAFRLGFFWRYTRFESLNNQSFKT